MVAYNICYVNAQQMQSFINISLLIHIDDIAHIKDMILKKDFDIIFSEFSQSDDGKLTPIYNKLNGKHSYADIQLVRLFLSL